MLHRKLDQFCGEQRPVWVFLRDQQRWIEQAIVVEIVGALVTLRYDMADDDGRHSWEESVRLKSIRPVSTRLAAFSRSGSAEDLETADDCPESERLHSQG